jgi:hypothetical protein
MRTTQTTARLYDQDFYLWARDQAGVLRREAARRVNTPLDLENLAEEIEALAKRDRRALLRRTTRIIGHLLKLRHSPASEPRAKWEATVRVQRLAALAILEDSPSLRIELEASLDRCWRDGLMLAAASPARDGVVLDPATTPEIPLDRILDMAWLPEGPRAA